MNYIKFSESHGKQHAVTSHRVAHVREGGFETRTRRPPPGHRTGRPSAKRVLTRLMRALRRSPALPSSASVLRAAVEPAAAARASGVASVVTGTTSSMVEEDEGTGVEGSEEGRIWVFQALSEVPSLVVGPLLSRSVGKSIPTKKSAKIRRLNSSRRNFVKFGQKWQMASELPAAERDGPREGASKMVTLSCLPFGTARAPPGRPDRSFRPGRLLPPRPSAPADRDGQVSQRSLSRRPRVRRRPPYESPSFGPLLAHSWPPWRRELTLLARGFFSPSTLSASPALGLPRRREGGSGGREEEKLGSCSVLGARSAAALGITRGRDRARWVFLLLLCDQRFVVKKNEYVDMDLLLLNRRIQCVQLKCCGAQFHSRFHIFFSCIYFF